MWRKRGRNGDAEAVSRMLSPPQIEGHEYAGQAKLDIFQYTDSGGTKYYTIICNVSAHVKLPTDPNLKPSIVVSVLYVDQPEAGHKLASKDGSEQYSDQAIAANTYWRRYDRDAMPGPETHKAWAQIHDCIDKIVADWLRQSIE